MCRELPPIKPVQAHLHSNSGMTLDSPPFDRTVSSSSRRALQTTPQDSSHRIVTSPPEDQSRNAGLDGDERAGSYDIPQATIQNPLSEQYGDQPSGSVRQRASSNTAALPEPPPVFIDPQPSEAHIRVDGYLDGAGQSQSNPRSTPSDRSASRRGVRGDKGSRGLPVRNNDKGRPRPGVRPNDPKPSRMLPVLTLAYLYLTQLTGRFST